MEIVKEWLVAATHASVLIINAMALIVVVAGTVEAFFRGVRALASTSTGYERRDIWLRYARWLVAGLTFQLAADIVETSIAPTWDEIGRLAAIAVIRTFLNFFLDRDLAEVRELQERTEPT